MAKVGTGRVPKPTPYHSHGSSFYDNVLRVRFILRMLHYKRSDCDEFRVNRWALDDRALPLGVS